MEGCCDIGGPKYPWPAVNREMKSSRVRLSPGCHRVIELGDDPRIVVLTRHHKWLQMVSLYEEHGVSKPRVCCKGQEIIVQLPMIISIPAANIPRNGVAGKVRYSRLCIVVSIPACHAGDPGSIPGNGAIKLVVYPTSTTHTN